MLSLIVTLCFAMLVVGAYQATAQETLEQLVAGAKKESEFTFIAGAQTFGGTKNLSVLEMAFNKRFGLNAKIRFAAGPEMNAMAARVITELKSGNKASSDIYHGSQSHFALLHKEKALQRVKWSGVFPWITKPMEIFPEEALLVFTSLRGMIYNSNLISKEKAPKTYEDLVDPHLSPTWAGKLAIPPYVSWLVELSMIWSEERVKNFTRKLVAIGGGRLRYSEEERVVSGEFPIAANMGGAVEQMWQWQAKGAPAHGGDRLNTRPAILFSIGRAEELGASQSGKAVRRFYGFERSAGHSRQIRLSLFPFGGRNPDGEVFAGKSHQASRAQGFHRLLSSG
jgi:hypothetical protein